MSTLGLKRPSLDYPEIPVYQLLKGTGGRIPHKIAVIDPAGQREFTYQDIDRESDLLTRKFLEWGVQKGDCISFFMANGWEYFVGFYAAMKVGAIVSSLNPTFCEREVKNQIDDAQSKFFWLSKTSCLC